MLQLTAKAAKHLQMALSKVSPSEGKCFRIGVTEDGARLLLDEERPGDVIVKHEDEVLLVMDPTTAEFLQEYKIDYDEAVSRLVFT